MIKRSMIGLFAALLYLSFSPKAQAQTVECSLAVPQPVSVIYGTAPNGYTFATSWNSDYVYAIHWGPGLSDCNIVEEIPVGSNSWGLAFDGTYIWASLYNANSVAQIDAGTLEVVHTYPTNGSGPKGVTWDGTYIWVVNSESNTISKINTANGVVSGPYGAIGESPWTAVYDGTRIWVTSGPSNQVTVLNENGSVQWTLSDSGCGQNWLAQDTAGHMWVACYSSKSVRGYSITTGALYAAVGATGHGGIEGLTTTSNTVVGVTWSGSLFDFSFTSPPTDATFIGTISGSPNCYDIFFTNFSDTAVVADFGGNLVSLVEL
jgi:DNA-binding beta-propeller fold protein YncE